MFAYFTILYMKGLKDNVSIYKPPTNPEVRKKWFDFVAKTWDNVSKLNTVYICSNSFYRVWLDHKSFTIWSFGFWWNGCKIWKNFEESSPFNLFNTTGEKFIWYTPMSVSHLPKQNLKNINIRERFLLFYNWVFSFRMLRKTTWRGQDDHLIVPISSADTMSINVN